VAVALCDGTVGLGQFAEERIKDPDLQKIMTKIKVMRNPEYNKQYPETFPCFIEIKSKSGETFTKTVTYPRGHPKNPLTDRELEEKFNTLNSGLINDDTVNEIIDNIWRLETLKDIGSFMKLFKVGK
jgi:2-methylcitrate dehydratase